MNKRFLALTLSIAALAAFGVFSTQAHADSIYNIVGIAGTSDTNAIQGEIHTIQQEINKLQTQLANPLGGSVSNPPVFTSSTIAAALPQALGTGDSPTFAAVNVSGSVSSTSGTIQNATIPTLNSVFNFPSPASLAAGNCPNFPGVTEIATCWKDLYNSVSSTASTTQINMPIGRYPSSAWTQQDVFDTLGEKIIINCVQGGTILNYSGTSTAITINNGDDHLGFMQGILGCTVYGGGSVIGGVNATTTFVKFGGSQGAEGAVLVGNTIKNWGTGFEGSSNTWDTILYKNSISRNATSVVEDAANNSGEDFAAIDNDVFDVVNAAGTANNCIVLLNNAVAGGIFAYNSKDDCQLVISNGNQKISLVSEYNENPGWNTYGAYDMLQIGTSTQTAVIDFASYYLNDAPAGASTSVEFVAANANYTAYGVTFSKGATAGTVARAVNNNLGNNDAFITLCNIVNNSGTAYTNLYGAAANPTNQSTGCFSSIQGSQLIGTSITAGNLWQVYDNGVQLTLNANGHLMVNGSGSATTSIYVNGSVGGLSNVTNFSTTITTANGKYLFFTGPANASATLPLWSASQGMDIVITNDSTSSVYQVQTATSTDFIFDCLTGTTTTFNLLPKESTTSSIEVINDGLTTSIFRTICSAH